MFLEGFFFFFFFYLPDRAISTKKWNNCGNKNENLYLTFLQGCSSVSSWLWATPIQTSYFISLYNLHYLLFSGMGAMLCHNPYCFLSQSQTLFGTGAGRPPITAVARWLFRRQNTFDFAGGRGKEGGRGGLTSLF